MSIPATPIRRDVRVFISAVSRELASVRKLVKKGLEDNDYHAVEQDNFPPDYIDLTDMDRKRIASCDAVIHIAGHCYGFEPRQRPADAPRRSYTQLEYEFAVELGKPVYVFLTGDHFPTDPHDPEPAELRELQEAHRQRLTSTGRVYNIVASTEQLDQKVRSLQFKVERLQEELEQVDAQVGKTGRHLRRWLAVVALLVIASLGAIGYIIQRLEAVHKEAEAARQQAQTIKQLQLETCAGLLDELLADKTITGEEARQRALKRLSSVKGLPLVEIESLIEHKIPRQATDPSPSPVDKARAALAQGNYDAVFQAADEQKQQGRELAMLEGTAALAKFRESPKPEWNTRALAAFQRAMASANPQSATEWEPWTNAALAAAEVLRVLARYPEAEQMLRDCLRLREANIRPNAPAVAVVLNNLAQLLKATNRLTEAEPLMRRALAIDERAHCPDHPNVATDLNNLAVLLQATKRWSEAEPLLRRALAIDERAYCPDHPNVATDLNNLAELLEATKRVSEAEPLYRRALAIAERSPGPNHPDVATDLNNLAEWLLADWQLRMRDAIVATDLNNLAELLQATKRLSEAEPLLRRALAIDERAYDPGHPDVATCLNSLAEVLQATNRLTEAEPLMARAVGILSRFQRANGHEHPDWRDASTNYEQLLAALKLPEPEIAARMKAAREGTGKLAPIVPEVERLLGPARPVADVLAALERQDKEQGKPPIYFLKPKEPIAPHLDQLLGPAKSTKEVFEALDRKYRAEGKPPVWFLPLNEPIAPHLDQLLGPIK